MNPLLTLLPLLAVPQPTDAAWPRFRGPEGISVLAEGAHPSVWNSEEHLAWSVEVPGGGWSSPIVIGERVFLTTAVPADGSEPKGFNEGVSDPMTFGRGGKAPSEEVSFRLVCLSLADGEERWTREVGALVPAHAVHPSNTYATESPASDGQRLFVTFGALGEVVAFDLAGEELWRVETGVFPTGNDFGWGISLVAAGGLVFAQNDNAEASFLVALDAGTGELRWRAERAKGSSWGTPVMWDAGGREQLVACGPNSVVGYEPSTGKELWHVSGVGGSFSSSPTFDAERLYFGNSGPMSRGPLMAVAAGAEGAIDLEAGADEVLAWRADRSGPGFPSPVLHDGLLYVVGSTAIVSCHDAATGERLWRERLPDGATVVACPWIVGDELFLLDEKGTTYVVRTGPEFELLRTNQLDGLYWSTPSVADGALLLRAADRLHCVRE